jgi:hypothetical protein
MGTNPNTMTFKTVFSAEYQMSHFKEPVYQILADTRLESALTKGQTIARSYASDVQVNDMGADGSYSTQAITDTQETLVINKEKEASIYIKKLDELQAHLPLKQKYGRKLANALINQIDGDVLLAAYQGAGTSLDDASFGGTTGLGLTVTASNVATVFTTAMQKLRLKNVVYNKRFQGGAKLEVPEGMPIAVISPEILSYIELYLGGKDTLLGDQVSRNGYAGYFMGFELFVSNALAWTAELALPTIPTDTDTLTINGVVLTADADGAAVGAGHYSIQAAVDDAAASLVQLINGTGTAGVDNYIDVSAADRRKLKNITASYDTGTNLLTLVSSGWGTVEVSETFTAAGNVFTTGKEQIHPIFALSKSLSLVVQKDPSMEENPVSGKIGRDYIAWTVYGIKVFVDQAPMIVQLSVNSAAFTAAATDPK